MKTKLFLAFFTHLLWKTFLLQSPVAAACHYEKLKETNSITSVRKQLMRHLLHYQCISW